jgi:DNA-directed RNA polymerase subunit RPC12/RpoP
MKDDYSRSVSAQCSTCGGTDFEFENEDDPIRCVGCDRIYLREELVRENDEQIDRVVENMKSEIIADVHKDFKKMFKKFR